MKIKTNVFKEMMPVILATSSGVDSIGITKSIFFNFETDWAYFFQDKQTIGRVKFEKEGDFSSIKNFAVDVSKFVFTANRYDELEITPDYHFTSGNDSYKFFPIIGEDLIDSSLFYGNKIEDEIDFSESELKKLVEIAKTYTNPDDKNMLSRSVLINKGKVFALAMNQIYEGSSQFLSGKEKVSFPPVVQIFITKMSDPIVASIKGSNHLFYLSNKDKTVEIVTPMWDLKEIFDTTTPDFVANYNHEDYIQVKRKDLEEAVSFCAFFFGENINSRIALHLKNEALYVEVIGDDDIKKHCDVFGFQTSDDEVRFELNGSKLLKALKSLQGEDLTIRYNSEKVLIALSCGKEAFIALAKITS